MKQTIILTVFFLFWSLISNAEEKKDTTNTTTGHSVTVVGNANDSIGSTITYNNQYDEWVISESFNLPLFDISHKKINRKKTGIESHLPGFYLGFNKAIDPVSGFDNTPIGSVELGFVFIDESLSLNENFGFTMGFGLNWRNFKLTDDVMMRKQGGYIVCEKLPENYSLDYSKLRIFGFTVPAVFEFMQSTDGFHGYIGAQADIRVARTLRNNYTDDEDTEHKEKRKHVRTLPIGCDVIAELGYKDFGIYGKYCPIRLFESGRGPINQSFTIGLKWNW